MHVGIRDKKSCSLHLKVLYLIDYQIINYMNNFIESYKKILEVLISLSSNKKAP